MASYFFDRNTEALRRHMLEGPPKQPTFKPPAVLNVKADDGTVIPIPYALLGDTARIVVSTPAHLSVGSNKTYVVSIDNRNLGVVEKLAKNFAVKQGIQKSIVKVIASVFGANVGQVATKPVGFIVGMLQADDLGNNSAHYYNTQIKSTDGKTIFVYLTGDRVL